MLSYSGANHQLQLRARAALELRRRREAGELEGHAAGGVDWRPFPGSPQDAAYHSEAIWIGYGGAAGGGKTDLGLGLAGTKHRRSVIFRRIYKTLAGTIERSREVYNAQAASRGEDSYNESLHRWRLSSGRLVQFDGIEHEKNKEDWRGVPFDLHVFDEATQFTESMVRFVTGWNRTSVPGQSCRVLLTFNPPTDEAGRWVIRFFLPWMAFLYPKLQESQSYLANGGIPAAPGELRHYLMGEDGKDVEVPAETPKARSRTFFPAKVEDNPVYMAQGYDATLEAMPEPLRSQMRYGDFGAGIEADPWQIIPHAWTAAAKGRWAPQTISGRPSGAGLDVARGGRDQTVVARLYGSWLAPLQVVPGAATDTGPKAAALVIPDLAQGVPVGVDVIGVGASAFDSLVGEGLPVASVNFSESAKDPVTGLPFLNRSGKLRFLNLRAYGYWLVREALDPEGEGERLALPPDDALITELCTPRWSLTSRGIQVESKEDVIKRVGYSPDRADALVIALLAPLLAKSPEVSLRWL
jgi:hypothetical protein